MPTPPDSLTPAPMPQGEPDPWSEGDFAPIAAYLHEEIGIDLGFGRAILFAARLRHRLILKGWPSFTLFYRNVLFGDAADAARRLLQDVCDMSDVVDPSLGGA